MTLGLLKAMEIEGVRCPEDLSLATFDDLTIDRTFHPHLTAVVQPGYEMGARAATILMDRIEGKMTGPPNSLRIVPTLVLRESSAMYPKAAMGRARGRRPAVAQRPLTAPAKQ
jgi:LacI family transcriptional regulator